MRSESRKQHAPSKFGPWLHAMYPKRVFGGKIGQVPERRDHHEHQHDNIGDFRGYEYRRRYSLKHKRPSNHNQRGGGAQPQTADLRTEMESPKFPSKFHSPSLTNGLNYGDLNAEIWEDIWLEIWEKTFAM